MPDMGPETAATANEEPIPASHEGRLLGARLSVNVLVGGVLVLLLLALIPFYLMKGTGPAHTESPAPNAPEAARWNGSNSQVSNWPAPLSADSSQANDNSSRGNRSSGPNNGGPLGVVSPQDPTAWGSPGAQPSPPATIPAADGSTPWNGQTPRTPAADAAGPWGGNRNASWSNPPNMGDTAADRGATAWGDPSQSVMAVPQAVPANDPNRPVGPMMPTAPPVHGGVYEAARPAPAYQNSPSEPNAYTADARGGPAAAPWGAGPATGPSSYLPSGYPNNANRPSGNPNSGNSPGVNPSGVNPSSGYPPGGYPNNGYPNSANPSSANPSSANPTSGYPAGGYPNNGYPSSGYPNNTNSSGGYPNRVNPPSANPNSGYPPSVNPNGSYPNNVNPTGSYPPSSYPNNVNPGGGYPSSVNPGGGYPSTSYPSSNYPSNNANVPSPGASGPAVNPTTNGAAGYYGGTADPASARFNGGIERPTIPGSYDNAQSSLH
jgi:hypothetical protein